MKNFYFIHKNLWKATGIATAMLISFGGNAYAIQERNLAATPTQNQTHSTTTANSDQPELASKASDDFKGGAKSMGSGFKNGAKVTGHAFKKAGNTMGRAFKKAGSSIKTFFVGKKDNDVQENDLSPATVSPQEAAPTGHYNRDLDRVGS